MLDCFEHIQIYLNFVKFLHTETTQVVEFFKSVMAVDCLAIQKADISNKHGDPNIVNAFRK